MEDKIKNKIIENLKEVYDPEIPINVYDLGLIYEIKKIKDKKWEIIMSLTSENCPAGDFIIDMVKSSCENVVGENNAKVTLTFSPRWNSSMVSEEVREELGIEDENPKKQNKKKCHKCYREDSFLIKSFIDFEDNFICVDCLKKVLLKK